MNRFKKEAMADEFQGVADVLAIVEQSMDDIDFIEVKRLDEAFLLSFPSCEQWDGSAGETYENTRLFGVTDGETQEIPISCKGTRGSNYAYSPREDYEGETYLESLSRLENPDGFYYFVRYYRLLSDWQGQDGENERSLTIFKPPKKEKIKEIIERARNKARLEVMKETDF